MGARAVRWVALLLAPVTLNLLIWTWLVLPQQRQLQDWQNAQAFAAIEPKLVMLIKDGGAALKDWQRTSMSRLDPGAVTQRIQQLAARYHVQVAQLEGGAIGSGKSPHPGFVAMSVTLQATGSYGQLAQWMSQIESQSGLQIDSWTLTSAAAPEQPHQLKMELTALLRSSA